MGVIAQYQVAPAFPSTVGGTGTTIKYFSSNPPQSLWNSGVAGVNSPVNSGQLGNTPSASSALGQISLDVVAQKLTGARFRMYASGWVVDTGASVGTFTPVIQINTGTVASPSYATLAGGVVSSASVVQNKPVQWSIAADIAYDPNSGTIQGFHKYAYAAASGGTPLSQTAAEAVIPTVPTGLTITLPTAGIGGPGIYATQPGFVVGVTFGTSDAGNSASLTEFKIVED